MDQFELREELASYSDGSIALVPPNKKILEILDFLASSPSNICCHGIFQDMRRHFSEISQNTYAQRTSTDCHRLFDITLSGMIGQIDVLVAELEDDPDHVNPIMKTALEMYALLFLNCISVLDDPSVLNYNDKKPLKRTAAIDSPDVNYNLNLQRVLDAICKLFKSRISRVWPTISERDDFVG